MSAMSRKSISRRLLAAAPVGACMAGILFVFTIAPCIETPAGAQTNEPRDMSKQLPLKPDIPGVQVNHRLILKDGTYQIVRKYEVIGDRVRYISVERSGDWEELPYDLIDWPATKKWEQQVDQAAAEATSPAMQEAAEIDKQEAAEREANKDRMPEVARGLNLPDQDGVFVLDTYQGQSQLVELVPSTGDLQMSRQHGLRSVLPLQSQMARVELEGPAAKVHLHINEPVLYLSLDDSDHRQTAEDQVTAHAMTVDTKGASSYAHGKRGATSPNSGFAIVRVDERRNVRIVGTVKVSPTGQITQQDNVIPTKVEVLPGKDWLKITPIEPLTIGEYALVEILDSKDMNANVWDFQVNPRAGINESAIVPIDAN